ncbi:metal-sensitive transcriptional regulator [Lacticaseibacillus baoqingensis]|uniref:Metal-sensitive transcriptional regulator n=1 Tax=Lacticaseibacillus baoqingensis TaxID=2486013 RepID=A0ABW4E6Y1_9LACO|nr:metal-sensitive transcriptional regulator [Lacticaseibacillus baoqingensis]
MTLHYDKAMENRLKRADGQLQGTLRMMQNNSECQAVVSQLTAVRSSLDNLIGLIVAENLKDCLLSGDEADRNARIEQAVKLIVKK